ncbi:MAG: hypothetical protein GWP10_12115 [Nitrospiraceae bacterium]|nr:hypothetical protein [Nitrospiraceae bacterium]
MKINLLTFHATLNYGAVWQAYALSKTLIDMGHEVCIIDLRPPWQWPEKGPLNPVIWLRRRKFERLLKYHFPPFTKTYRESADLRRDLPSGDAFIVGSDQVWNPNITGRLMDEYFLRFVPDGIPKVSYAASFGKKRVLWSQNQQVHIAFLLNRFDAISVRENSGRRICHTIAEISPVVVLDPVFLLSDSDYLPLCSQLSIGSNGLVCYKFDKGPGFIETVDYMSKVLNMRAYIIDRFRTRQLLMVPAYTIFDRLKRRSIKSIWIPSPERWLASLRQASFIFTDSFHGLAFSLIFRKNFVVTPANPKRFTRIEELLRELKLENRIFHSYDEIRRDHRWKEAIDYNKVDKIISKKIESSLDFLRNAL